MKKIISFLLISSFLTGCSLWDDTKKAVEDGKTSVTNVVEEGKEAVNDIQNAAKEVKEATEAIKEITE